MYKTRSCWMLYHPLNRFLQGNGSRASTSWKWFNIEVFKRSTWFHFELNLLNFLDFYEKAHVKRKRPAKIILAKKKNPENILKCSGKKHKNFKATWAVLGHSKPKTFSVGQPWWVKFFRDLGHSSYFNVATVLEYCKAFKNNFL